MHAKYNISDRAMCALLCIGCLCAIVSVTLTPWNETVSQCLAIHHLPGDCKKIVQLTEVFGHGIGVLAILGFMAVLEPKQRRETLFIGILALGAGGFAEIVNAIVSTISYVPVWRSFPSGHGATAVAFAIGLTLVLPQGKWFFSGLAVMTMVQQVADHAHILSDVMAGAAIGMVWAVTFLRVPFFRSLFELFEAYWDRPVTAPQASPAESKALPTCMAVSQTDASETTV